jgi:hypothetical protein
MTKWLLIDPNRPQWKEIVELPDGLTVQEARAEIESRGYPKSVQMLRYGSGR